MEVKITIGLYAYSQIDKCKKYLEENGIYIPRLCGLRLMKEQKLLSDEDIEKKQKYGTYGPFVQKQRAPMICMVRQEKNIN